MRPGGVDQGTPSPVLPIPWPVIRRLWRAEEQVVGDGVEEAEHGPGEDLWRKAECLGPGGIKLGWHADLATLIARGELVEGHAKPVRQVPLRQADLLAFSAKPSGCSRELS